MVLRMQRAASAKIRVVVLEKHYMLIDDEKGLVVGEVWQKPGSSKDWYAVAILGEESRVLGPFESLTETKREVVIKAVEARLKRKGA